MELVQAIFALFFWLAVLGFALTVALSILELAVALVIAPLAWIAAAAARWGNRNTKED